MSGKYVRSILQPVKAIVKAWQYGCSPLGGRVELTIREQDQN
jgi:hypothetical protein